MEARRRELSCLKEVSGDDLLSESQWRRSGLEDAAGTGADVDDRADRAGTWPCTKVAPAGEPAMSKPEGWPIHFELLLGPMLKEEEVWGPDADVFIDDAVPRLCWLLLMGMEDGELVV